MRPIYQIAIFFILAQLLALGVGITLIENAAKPEYQALNIAPAAAEEMINVFYFFLIIIIGAVVLLFVLLLPIRDIVIKILEFIATFVSSSIVFYVILSAANFPEAETIAAAISILLYGGRILSLEIKNVLAIVASAGIGALIGFSMDPFPTTIFVIAIAIYDIIAVWWTGHMVEFAKYFVKERTAFTVSAIGAKVVRVKGKKKLQPVFMDLGTGDLAIPAALSVSVYKLGLLFSFATVLGSIVGLLFVLEKVEREKVILPAMPSIAIGAFVALFLSIIINLVI